MADAVIKAINHAKQVYLKQQRICPLPNVEVKSKDYFAGIFFVCR